LASIKRPRLSAVNFERAFLRGTSRFSAALRFQQQRSEIMNRLSSLVNNFLNCFVATVRGSASCAPESSQQPNRTASLLLPRRVSGSAKEA
ncbi:hypothetical protein, partial [Burkholderia vietnamiensis]|uniref:hypothetical protein n=1 Tax=Burkholderia vietnamiensis TaxID=60552 RepID=UPI001CC5C959